MTSCGLAKRNTSWMTNEDVVYVSPPVYLKILRLTTGVGGSTFEAGYDRIPLFELTIALLLRRTLIIVKIFHGAIFDFPRVDFNAAAAA
jgi:hypothetical protein